MISLLCDSLRGEQGNMTHKIRRLLVLLLIILEESGPTIACSSSCSSECYCTHRGLNGVPQFLPKNIIYLSLYQNEITTLRQYDFARYKALETLNLRSNQISVINSDAFYNATILTWLSLYGNRLTSLQAYMFEGLDNLESLVLYGNGMTSIEAGTFSRTPQLRTLDLRSNRLNTIAAGTFANLPQFRSLDLFRNSISTIEADTFVNLPQFESLDLANNRMNTFPVGLFSNLSTLSNLDIENNQIETLQPLAYEILASISTSNLGSNPWQCDCRMLPFKQKMTGSYLFEYTITCAGPGSFQGKSLLQDVDPDDMICEDTTVSSTSSLGASSPTVVQLGASTSFETSSTELNAHSTPGLSTVHPSSLSNIVEKSTPSTTSPTTPSATNRATPTSGLYTVSTSPSSDQPGTSTLSTPAAYATHTADSTPGLSAVSDSPPSHKSSTSTVQQPSTTRMARVTHIADSTPSLSMVRTSSHSDPAKSSLPSTKLRPTSASTHVQPKLTEIKPGPSLVWFSLPSFLNGLLGAAVLLAGLLVIRAIFFTIRCIHKRRTREAPSSQNSTVSFANTNLSAAVTVGGQVQTGQDRSSIVTSTEGYTDVIPSQPGPRQNLHRNDEQGYQILPLANVAGSQAGYHNVSAAAHGADADAPDQYEALSLRH